MRQLRVPQIFIGGVASLPDLLRSFAKGRDFPRDLADQMADIVPAELRASPCFLDRLTGLWRYEFGNPFDGLPDGGLMFGTHMYMLVEQLLDVLLCAKKRLSVEQFNDYLKRIDDPNKHADLVFEFAPIIRLAEDIKTEYEVVGYGEGKTMIDWFISPLDCAPILLEVKNRTKDLWESLILSEEGECDAEGNAPAPVHDVSLLFRNLDKKFSPRTSSEILQGAWIGTGIKQEKDELLKAFSVLDRTKIHFVVLGDFKKDVYILSDNAQVREDILKVLQCCESGRFVFSRNEG